MHKILKPKGEIYFAAEPITNIFPLPWTLRLDGESLFVIRKHGWMELGFRADFFSELLNKTGWDGECMEEGFWKATKLINSPSKKVDIKIDKIKNIKQTVRRKLRNLLVKFGRKILSKL